MTITPGKKTTSSHSSRHPYTRNDWKGTPEIEETFRKIYEVRDRIRERGLK